MERPDIYSRSKIRAACVAKQSKRSWHKLPKPPQARARFELLPRLQSLLLWQEARHLWTSACSRFGGRQRP